jgi:hypothetical protein
MIERTEFPVHKKHVIDFFGVGAHGHVLRFLKEYKEFKRPPKIVAKWTQMLASNAAHLARLLKAQHYPGIKGGR